MPSEGSRKNPQPCAAPLEGRRTGGFTLLEILIAVSILAVILSTVFASYTGTFQLMQETGDTARIYAMARTALERIQDDLSGAYLETEGAGTGATASFVGTSSRLAGLPADRLCLLSSTELDLDPEALPVPACRICYTAAESAEEGESDTLMLYRTESPAMSSDPADEARTFILAQGLLSVRFQYREAEGDWVDGWDSRGKDRQGGLPEAVQISLSVRNPLNDEQPLQFMTAVRLPVSSAGP